METDTDTPSPTNDPVRVGRIYKITCNVTNLCYIGKTIQNLTIRFRQHFDKKSYCRLLKDAINEYSKDNFSIETLWEGDFNLLGEMERKMIKHHNTMTPNGYNLREGGGRSERVSTGSRKLMISKQREISLRKNGKLGSIIKNISKVDGRITSWTVKCFRNGKPYKLGKFNTKEEALTLQEEYTQDPENYPIPPSTHKGRGNAKCIYYSNKRNKWSVIVGKTFLGRFDTQEHAQYELDKFKNNQ